MSHCAAPADRITAASPRVVPLASRVVVTGCPPSDGPGGAHTRTTPPKTPTRAAAPTASPTSPRPPYIDNSRTSCSHIRRLWPRPTILRHHRGLAASPPVRYTLGVARRAVSLPLSCAASCGRQSVRPSDARERPRLRTGRLVVSRPRLHRRWGGTWTRPMSDTASDPPFQFLVNTLRPVSRRNVRAASMDCSPCSPFQPERVRVVDPVRCAFAWSCANGPSELTCTRLDG